LGMRRVKIWKNHIRGGPLLAFRSEGESGGLARGSEDWGCQRGRFLEGKRTLLTKKRKG